jgi:hypothetical protein
MDEYAWDRRSVDRACLAHVVASKAAAKGVKHFGFAVDKANCRGIDLLNGFAVLPDNTAFELVPQAPPSMTL